MSVRWDKPTTTHLDILTPELLLEMANEARDHFEWLDSVPAEPGQQFDGSAEETAELLEELVRTRAPQLVEQLASHMPGVDETPRWKWRHMQIEQAKQATVYERDPEEPAAHIAHALDTLCHKEGGAHAVDDMLLCASMALLRAIGAARYEADSTVGLLQGLYDNITNIMAS